MSAERIGAADLCAEWVSDRALIAQRDGHAIRAGLGLTIEVQSINPPHRWHTMQLPNNATSFVDEPNRDAVLATLRAAINQLDAASCAGPVKRVCAIDDPGCEACQ